MDLAERELLAATVRDALASAVGDADDVLAALGWSEMLAAEPDAATAIVFQELGRSNVAATVLDDVVLHALGIDTGVERAVLVPPFGTSLVAADREQMVGLATHRVTSASELVVVRDDQLEMIPIDEVDVHTVRGIDPDARLHTVRVNVTRSAAVDRRALTAGTWDDTVAFARRALAYEIAGASRTMLDLACTHALERVQFGRPVARFQAVRHKLAEALVAVEALDAVLGVAADEPGVTTAALAKAVAGRSAARRGHARPTGARRDRLHHRPPVPPLVQAHDVARRPVRLERHDRARARAQAARRTRRPKTGRALGGNALLFF